MCIFCKIANKEIPCYKVYEDDLFLAFLDISQATKGHTLVIPKKHYQNLFELDENIKSSYLNVIQKVGLAIKKATNCEGINILNNNGEAAGQTVFHCHIHIIPRYSNDSLKIEFGSIETSKEEFELLQNNILKNI